MFCHSRQFFVSCDGFFSLVAQREVVALVVDRFTERCIYNTAVLNNRPPSIFNSDVFKMCLIFAIVRARTKCGEFSIASVASRSRACVLIALELQLYTGYDDMSLIAWAQAWPAAISAPEKNWTVSWKVVTVTRVKASYNYVLFMFEMHTW